MPLSKISSLSHVYRSSVRRRHPPPSIAVFSLPNYDSSFHPLTASVAPRLMHSPSQPQCPITRMTQLTDVSLSITKRLLQDEGKNKNVVFSPLSIHVLLSLVAAGSTGPTLDQLLTFLKSNSLDELNHSVSQIASFVLATDDCRRPRLEFACGAWVDQSLPLNPSFKHLLGITNKPTLQQLDFRTEGDKVVSKVNSWVEKHMSGLITNSLSPGSIKSTTNTILANSLYFKGGWMNKFTASKTKHHEFYLLDGSSVEVPFMTNSQRQFIAAYDGFKVLQLQYDRRFGGFHALNMRGFSMFIFLPDAKDGLPSLVEKLDSQPGFIHRHIPFQMVRVGEFKVPKFKFSFGVEVSKPLRKLGLVLPFFRGERDVVDSSSQMEYGFVSDILHKAYIEVNEKGTETSASSTMNLTGCSMMPPPKLDVMDFVADHPFLFVIREDMTRTLPFVGQVLNPNIFD